MGSDATEIVDPVGASIVAVTASVAQHVFPVDPQIEMQRVRLARPKVEARIAQDRGRRSALQDRVAALIEQPASSSGGGPRSGLDVQPFQSVTMRARPVNHLIEDKRSRQQHRPPKAQEDDTGMKRSE